MVEGPVTGRRIKRRTINYIAIGIAVVVVLFVIVKGTGTYYQQIEENAKQEQLAKLKGTAGKITSEIAASLEAPAAQLDKLVEQQKLISLFTEADRNALDAEAELLVKEFPSVLKLRLLLPGQYKLDREAKPPLGFASLDMLRGAEKSTGTINSELHQLNSPDTHIVMLRRVMDENEKLIGLIHLSLNAEPVLKIVEKQDIADMYIELVQSTSGKPLTLAKKGNANTRVGEPAATAIKGTSWYINVWDASGVPQKSEEPAELIGGSPLILIALIIVLLGIGFFIYRRKQGAGDGGSDDVVYEGAVKAIMEGHHPGLEKLVPNLPKLGQSKTIQPISQGLIGDDVTVVEKPDAIPASKITEAKVKKEKAEQPSPKAMTEKPASQQKPTPRQQPSTSEEQTELSPEIFRAYDIRGVVGKTLTDNVVHEIGRAIGSEAEARGQQSVVVGRDGRTSSPQLADSLINGLHASGRDVIDIGMVPTPVLYFATHHLDTDSGVMLTGSHNGPEYNGLKIVLAGETLASDAIQSLLTRIQSDDFTSGEGQLQTADITADYIRRVTEDIPVALGGAFKIVIDCGNGVAGILAPQIFRAMGHDVIELYCEVDGKFPNHHPDPSQPENLEALITKVKEEQADLGLAFDGDGDRLGVVDSDGNIIWPDRQMMLLAKDVLSRNQGAPIIFDVKCSRYLKSVIEHSGGKPLMWKTGHSLIKAKMKEEDAPLAGEMSGHIFFKERWYGFDDAIYSGARLVEILTKSKEKPVEVFAELPGGIATPEIRINLAEKHHSKFMNMLRKKMSFEDAEVTEIDGVRVDFPDGWGLIRPSNTSPCLIARFEADDESSLQRIQSEFRALIKIITPDLKLPF